MGNFFIFFLPALYMTITLCALPIVLMALLGVLIDYLRVRKQIKRGQSHFVLRYLFGLVFCTVIVFLINWVWISVGREPAR